MTDALHTDITEITETFQSTRSQSIFTNSLIPDQYQYVTKSQESSKTDLERMSLVKLMNDLELNQNRILYFMTLTYKPFETRTYQERDVNKFFRTFYVQKLLPYLINKNYHRVSKRYLQPIGLVFVDDHETKAIKKNKFHRRTDSNDLSKYIFPVKLHHHAVLALHPDTVEKMNYLLGENTLANSSFTHKIMTSDLQRCDADAVMYSSKMLWKYPEYQVLKGTTGEIL